MNDKTKPIFRSAVIGLVTIFLLSAPLRAETVPLDFTNDVAPIFTKAGCNGGGCHGKSTGRGGFQLSLFGFRPEQDFDAITRGSRGRRVFPNSPDESLLLRKATMAVPHGGGKRLEASEPEYAVLRDWIAAGMPWGESDAPRIVSLELEPATARLAVDQELPLTAWATYSDGRRRDVTRLTRFQSGAPSIAEVDSWGVVRSQQRAGEAPVVALYQARSAVSRIVIPTSLPEETVAARLDAFPVRNVIDQHVADRLERLGLPPARVADDGTFLRRVTLQIAGRLPTLEETREFLDSSETGSTTETGSETGSETETGKRRQLVDRLLAGPEYADHFAQKWSDLLRNKRRGQSARIPGTIAFHHWIRNQLAANVSYDRFVREVLTATGNVTVNPPAQWYAEVRYLDRCVDDTAQVFLGLRIGCARCHHHPFENFSQEDYFGLAAFFARVDRKGGAGVAERRADETVFIKADGEVKHPVTDEVVAPRVLGGEPLELEPFEDPRHRLVDWMSEPDNPYFARALVNRLWAHFFGRGLVEPMDDMRVTNPATIAPLLDALTAEFIDSGFDVKHVIRLICNSTTYQLDSRAEGPTLVDTRNHARFYPQRLTAEVLLDAFDQVSGVATGYRGLPEGTRALQLPDEDYSNEFLRLFGRPQRESACECERSAEPSLSQSLFVMNNTFVLGKAMSGKGFAATLASDPRPEAEKLTELFLVAYARRPDERELAEAADYLATETDKRKAYGNLLWALMNSKEFMYVH